MSTSQTSRLLRAAPYFPVPDVDLSVTYYERVLGFEREYVAGQRDGPLVGHGSVRLASLDAPPLLTPSGEIAFVADKAHPTWVQTSARPPSI